METKYHTTLARTLLLAALDSYGQEALALADAARSLVGIVGIRSIGSEMLEAPGHETRVLGARVLGALSALRGEPNPPNAWPIGASVGGYDFVAHGGAFGAWSTLEE